MDVAFKLLIAVVCPLTNPNIVVDVAFILLIDNIELVDNEFKLPNTVVDVAFILLIDNIELVDNEFKLPNIVVDVAFILLIDNVELVDNEFKFVLVAYTDKLGVFITVEL